MIEEVSGNALATLLLEQGVSLWKGRVQGNMKANRQIPVRFGHARSVKLTLNIRRVPAPGWTPIRVLRIQLEESDISRVRFL